MKLFLTFLLLASPAWGVQASFTVTGTGGAPIPIAYSASDSKSLVISGLHGAKEVCIHNDTSSKTAFSILGTSTVAPSTPEVYLAGGQGACLSDTYLGPISAIYIRSASGSTITSGDVWGFTR